MVKDIQPQNLIPLVSGELIMIKKTPWTERTFNFVYPITQFPFYLERLRGTIPHLEDMIKEIDEEQLEEKQDNKWSIKEHIGHLADLEELHEKRLQELLSGKEKLSAADMSNRKTEEAQHNAKPIGNLLNELRAVRIAFIRKLEALDDTQPGNSSIHPRLQKPMRVVDMVYFVAEHDDHHLAAIRELLNNSSGSF
jgi:uncharacterized damage-inducible protein DinB